MDDFYKDYILEHYRQPRNFGHLEGATAAAEDLNPLCGDRLRFEMKVNDKGVVEDVRFSGRGCAISQASASMLTETLKGMPLEDVARLDMQVVLDNVGGPRRNRRVARRRREASRIELALRAAPALFVALLLHVLAFVVLDVGTR